MSNDLFKIKEAQEIATDFRTKNKATYDAVKHYLPAIIKHLRKTLYTSTREWLTERANQAASHGYTKFSIQTTYGNQTEVKVSSTTDYDKNIDLALFATEIANRLRELFEIENKDNETEVHIEVYQQDDLIDIIVNHSFSFEFPNAWSQAHFEHVNDFDYDDILDGDIQIHDSDPETRLLHNTGAKRFFNGSGLAVNNGFNSVMHDSANNEIIFDFTKED